MSKVFQPFPVVGCAFVEDAGTNGAGEFTGCAREWPGAKGSRCHESPDDCVFQRAGHSFEERGVWRVDRMLRHIVDLILNLTSPLKSPLKVTESH